MIKNNMINILYILKIVLLIINKVLVKIIKVLVKLLIISKNLQLKIIQEFY